MTAAKVYLEVGKKRVFATAVDWPGWSRGGRDEVSALQSLFDYSPRYASAVKKAGGFKSPAMRGDLHVIERVPGDASTDYGVPHQPAGGDSLPLSPAELDRLSKLLQACWQAFDVAAKAAASTTLRSGPRGGGRDVLKIHAHILDADAAYLHQLGGRFTSGGRGAVAALALVRRAFLETLGARLRGELPTKGPRGGERWSPRYAIRRSAWHSLDHAWEIEDRST